MFIQRHELHMRIGMFLQIGNEFILQKAVGAFPAGILLPSSGIQFINIHWCIKVLVSLLHPCFIMPSEFIQIIDNGSVCPIIFRFKGIGITLVMDLAMTVFDSVFILILFNRPLTDN